jgi:hypothetical protein
MVFESIPGSSHGMRNELSHSKEVAPAALCCIHGFGMALLAGRQKTSGEKRAGFVGRRQTMLALLIHSEG